MTKDIILNSVMAKPLTIEVSISELIGVTNDEIKQVAKASNGEFIKDRRTMKALDFLVKYFPTKQLQVTSYNDIVQQRTPITRSKTKVRVKKEKKVTGQDEIGHYVVALFESGDEFAVTYRKLDNAHAHFDFSMNTMTYKKDGRRFTMVGKHDSRKAAMVAKTTLIEALTIVGKTHLVGVLPV